MKHLNISHGIDLRTVESAPSSLEELTLENWPYLVSLSRLSGWTNLRSLALRNCNCMNIDAVATLTNLESLTLAHISARNLMPVHGLHRLRELRLEGQPKINLFPLGGKTDLLITVPETAQVSHEASLGE